MDIYAIKRVGNIFEIIDQTLLPSIEQYIKIDNYREMVEAIKNMQVRGAPAIGIAGMSACYLACKEFQHDHRFSYKMFQAISEIEACRPTAVSLSLSTRQVKSDLKYEIVHDIRSDQNFTQSDLANNFVAQISKLVDELMAYELDACEKMAENGLKYIPENYTSFLTHCNTGSLATYGRGTALGVLKKINENRKIELFVDETRPLFQGSRLTAWECNKSDICCTLITDNMVARTIQSKNVQAIIVGADRIAANGDTANKIGTFNLAIIAKHFGIPFYVVAPETTIDENYRTGENIIIEERASDEVTRIKGINVAPANSKAFNPAFDVTPAGLITAIITDKRVWNPNSIEETEERADESNPEAGASAGINVDDIINNL